MLESRLHPLQDVGTYGQPSPIRFRDAERFGIRATWATADWPAIRDRIFGRIDPKHDEAVTYRRDRGINVFLGEAHFVAPKVLQVGVEELHADRFVLAAGSRPVVPSIAGLD